jgi:hypothetical protein
MESQSSAGFASRALFLPDIAPLPHPVNALTLARPQALQAIKRQAQADADDELRKAEEERKVEELRKAAQAPPKSIVFNGHEYKTLAEHNPASTQATPNNSFHLYNMDPSWHICSPTPDALHVCTTYPWAAYTLVFADGSAYFTALAPTADGRVIPGARAPLHAAMQQHM